jgi:hypothetical protein
MGTILEDVFEIHECDREGKKFDKGECGAGHRRALPRRTRRSSSLAFSCTV